MQQRYYDPGIGRFLSVDPVTANGNTGGNFNRYWYANNNPYRFTDPDGRLPCSPCKELASKAIEAVTDVVIEKSVKLAENLTNEIGQSARNFNDTHTLTFSIGISGVIASPFSSKVPMGGSMAAEGSFNFSVNNHRQFSISASGTPMAGQGLGGIAGGVTYGVSMSDGRGVPKGLSLSNNHHAEIDFAVKPYPVSVSAVMDWNSHGGGFSAGSARYAAGTIMFAGGGEKVGVTWTINDGVPDEN